MINTWDSYCITPEDEGSGTKVLDSNDQVQPTLEAGSNIIIEEGHISADGTLENVQANWQTSDPDDPSYIRNKPQNLVQDADYVHIDNNFTDADVSKLEGIEAGAQVNVKPDWDAVAGSAAEILNKPTIPTVDQIYNANSTNAQSGVAVASAVSGAISEVNQVPVSISTDAGKVLKVNDQGEAVWGTDEGTTYTAGNGLSLNGTEFSVDTSVVATQSDLSDYQPVISDLNTIRSGAAAGATAVQPAALNDYATTSALTTGLASKQDTISDLATIRTGAGLGATAVQPGDLATVATTGSYDDLLDKPTIPSGAQLVPSATSADEGKFLIVDGNGLPEWSDLSEGSSYSIANGSVVFTPGQYYTNGVVTLSNIRSNGIDYAYNHDGWVLEQDHTYVIAFNIVAFVGYPETGNITGRIWLDGFQETDQVWKFSLDTSASHDESLVGSAIVCPQSTGEVHLNIRYDSPALEHIPTASVNKAEIVDVTARVNGSAATTYSAGAGLNLTGTTFSVDTTTIATKSDLSAYTPTASLGAVALSNSYNDLSDKPTIPPGVVVDQTYDATSANAQSGVAVAGALATKQDTLTAGTGISIDGNNVISSTVSDNTFNAVYGVTTLSEIEAAVNAGDAVFVTGIPNESGMTLPLVSFRPNLQSAHFYVYSGTAVYFAALQPSGHWEYQVYSAQADWNETRSYFPAYINNKPDLSVYATTTALSNGLATKQDTISDLATIRSGASAGATAVQPGSLATVATTGSYDDLLDKPTIPSTKPLVAGSNVTITENANDVTIAATDTTYSAGTGITISSGTISADTTVLATKAELPDGVPTVTSSDDDKVLKASYSGGTGSYSWEAEPTLLGLTAGSNVTITEANNAVTIAATDTTYTAGNMIAIDSNNSNAIGVSTTAGITDIQLVNALPASPVATVLYIIPET